MQRILLATLAILIIRSPAPAADWPQWLGPARTGASAETGLLTTWPSTGPRVLWKVAGGDGYSAVAVADGRAFTLVQTDKGEQLIALDATNGMRLWEATPHVAFKNMYGNGPRSTPTIVGDLVYTQSVTGPLSCYEVKTGKRVWEVDLLKEFGAKNITWGLSASPLVEGELVYALPGAPGAGVAAFDRKTGRLAWKSGNDKAAYASPIVVTVGGKRQIIFFNAAGLLAVTPEQGKELWRIEWPTEFDCNIATPLVIGGDQLFVSSGEEVGCVLYKLAADGPPTVVWESKGKKSVMLNYWANAVAHEGYLYGLSGEFDKRIDLNCVDLKNGKLKWSKQGFGKAAVLLADGHLFLTTKKGDVVLVRATPEKYEEKARLAGFLAETRTVPTLANKRLYLRDREQIFCLDVGAP
jgi:outer membrane protein assembly factor BamB